MQVIYRWPTICGIPIVIGIIALCLAHPWLTIPIGIGLYALWRTC